MPILTKTMLLEDTPHRFRWRTRVCGVEREWEGQI